ncbi:hypothetical protein TMatcc_009869 [Talaromyces marneffei ATCC 18224]|uniref:Polynucleotide adenylyltransferase n=1 Tax=Talaromyces marneffei (strain ATCC 18224 / CBS 334.59 / QM 7333) TaxID=441960 RepID=B6QTL2_TALMQ|nr:conserved hypothetical protein [Talaromyces marneffei ATCC 18224]KAE8548032.1 hypothetical protein EYB25_009825 [Talaromyces marneffei]
MRFGRQTCSLQCLALGDSRPILCDRPLSCLTKTTTPPAGPRRGYSSLKKVPLTTLGARYPVNKNSLKKTLEAQRTVNRERLVWKYYVRDKPDEGKTGDERTDNAAGVTPEPKNIKKVNNGSREVTRSKKYKPKPSRGKEIEVAHVRLPWVIPLEDGRAQRNPWLDSIQTPSKQNGDAKSILSNELLSLTAFLQPSSTEQAAVDYIIDDLSSKIQSIVPNPPQLIGSRYAELATNISAIDLMIHVNDERIPNFPKDKPPGISSQMKYKYLQIMTQTGNVLKDDLEYRDCRVIPDKSPSLVLFHRASGIPVRLFCRSYAPKIEEFIQDSISELPSLLPLYMTMRVFLESKHLFGWEAESLSSNGLVLLIMSFLKQQSEDFTSKCLAEQLLALLHTYGEQIDLTTTGISASPAEFFTGRSVRDRIRSLNKSGSNNSQLPDYLRGQRGLMAYKIHASHKGNKGMARHLCIQDPTNYLVDAGMRCFRTLELQQAFSGWYGGLKLALERWDEGHMDDGGILGQVLRADFGELVRRKKMLAA